MKNTFKKSYRLEGASYLSLSVYTTGIQKCEPLHQWGPGIRNHYLIHHIVSGKGYYKVNDNIWELHAGDTFLAFPYSEITYYADQKDPWEYYWVGFQGDDADEIIQKSLFSHEKPVLIQSDQGSLVKEALYDIYSSRGSQYKNSLLMTSMLYRALALFLPDSTDHSSHDLYSSYVTSAVEYIHHNYSYTITIDDIASYIGISRSHLFRAFKLHTGTSPKEYLTNYRIAQACNLLKQSDLSIQSVANSVGFDNGLYFSKVFHQKKGMTPSQWRTP